MARSASKVVDPTVTPLAWVPEEGCFRLVEQTVEKVTVGGTEQAFEVTTFGEKVVWIDDAPGDIEDGTGHYEVYTGDENAYLPSQPNAQEG
jgi:hypothetical protein